MLFFKKMKEAIEKIVEFLKKKRVIEAYIFGSVARGTAGKKSDIDLIVVMETNKPFFERYDDFMELILDLPFALDLLIYTPEEWKEVKERLFFKHILKEARRIA